MTAFHVKPFSEAKLAAHEDVMEVLDEFERQNALNEDIEIDFDIVENHHEDENMGETRYSDEEHHMQEDKHPQIDNDDEMADEEGDPDLAEDIFDEDIVDAVEEQYHDGHGKDILNSDRAIEDGPTVLEILAKTSALGPAEASDGNLTAGDRRSLVDVPTEYSLTTEVSEQHEISGVPKSLHSGVVEAQNGKCDEAAWAPSEADQDSEAEDPEVTQQESEQDGLEDHDDGYTEGDDEKDEHLALHDLTSENDELSASLHHIESSNFLAALESKSMSTLQEPSSDLGTFRNDPSSTAMANETGTTGEVGQDVRQIDTKTTQSEPPPRFSDHDCHIYPIVVHYQGDDICLFPPRVGDQQSETYFLKDENLVHENLRVVLEACRSVLAESITDREELGMNIESLSLDVSETDEVATSTSLSQIIELYLHLHHNDGVHDPEPLRLILTTRPNFSSQLDFLHSTASEGKGFLDLSETELPDPESFPDTFDTTSEHDDDLKSGAKDDNQDDRLEHSEFFVQESLAEQTKTENQAAGSAQSGHEHDGFVLDFGSPTRGRRAVEVTPLTNGKLDTKIDRDNQSDHGRDPRKGKAVDRPDQDVKQNTNGATPIRHSDSDVSTGFQSITNSLQFVPNVIYGKDAQGVSASENFGLRGNPSNETPSLPDEAPKERKADSSHTNPDSLESQEGNSSPEQLDFTNEDILDFDEEHLDTTYLADAANEVDNSVNQHQSNFDKLESKQSFLQTNSASIGHASHASDNAVELIIDDEINYDDEDQEEGLSEPVGSRDSNLRHVLGQLSTGEPNSTLESLKRPRSTEDEAIDIIDYEPHEVKKPRPV